MIHGDSDVTFASISLAQEAQHCKAKNNDGWEKWALSKMHKKLEVQGSRNNVKNIERPAAPKWHWGSGSASVLVLCPPSPPWMANCFLTEKLYLAPCPYSNTVLMSHRLIPSFDRSTGRICWLGKWSLPSNLFWWVWAENKEAWARRVKMVKV